MYLTLDIGNTRAKFALFEPSGQIVKSGFAENVNDLIASISGLEALAFCNVSALNFTGPESFCGTVFELNSNKRLPFTVNYETPETLGADRLASAAGAVHHYAGKDVLIVDAGTCLKLDCVNKQAIFQGGSIAPGLEMRYKALQAFTGKLPLVNDTEFNKWPGQSTAESILSGVHLGYLAEVEMRIREIETENPGIVTILTGGDAPLLAKRLKNRIFVEPLLLHYGLFHCLLLNEN